MEQFMYHRLLKALCCLVLILTAAIQLPAQAADLRGFGTVQELKLPAGQGIKFACDSPAHADAADP